MSKRAFDRLDVSPFDFDAISKRFADEEPYYIYPYDSSRTKRLGNESIMYIDA